MATRPESHLDAPRVRRLELLAKGAGTCGACGRPMLSVFSSRTACTECGKPICFSCAARGVTACGTCSLPHTHENERPATRKHAQPVSHDAALRCERCGSRSVPAAAMHREKRYCLPCQRNVLAASQPVSAQRAAASANERFLAVVRDALDHAPDWPAARPLPARRVEVDAVEGARDVTRETEAHPCAEALRERLTREAGAGELRARLVFGPRLMPWRSHALTLRAVCVTNLEQLFSHGGVGTQPGEAASDGAGLTLAFNADGWAGDAAPPANTVLLSYEHGQLTARGLDGVDESAAAFLGALLGLTPEDGPAERLQRAIKHEDASAFPLSARAMAQRQDADYSAVVNAFRRLGATGDYVACADRDKNDWVLDLR